MLGHTTIAARVAVLKPGLLETRPRTALPCVKYEPISDFFQDLGHSLRLSSNVGRDRFMGTTNSAEGDAPVHGNRSKGRSTPVAGMGRPNICSNRGTRCQALTCKICKTRTTSRFNPRSTITRASVGASLWLIRSLEKLIRDPVRGFNQNQQPYQPQPIQQHLGPPNMQNFPGQTSPMMVSPPMTPLSSGAGDPPSPGEFDQMYPPSPGFYSPSSPAGPGIQDPNARDPAQGQSRTMNMAMHPTGGGTQPIYEDDSDLYADADDDGGVTPLHDLNPNQLQGQNTGGPPTGTSGGHGNGPTDPNQLSSKRPTSSALGPPATCRLNGCDKPVFTDQPTGHRSEYCSQKHRE